MNVRYLIIGAGPTGLGAGHRLKEAGEDSFLLLERNEYAGGLSASFRDDAGFTWDIGGHVIFSHYDYFDRLLDSLLGDESLSHERESWVRIAESWVPYPFQNNIRHLPKELAWECIEGLLPGRRPEGTPENFGEWFEHVFGAGITRLFMRPYNFKVWATPAEKMAYNWIGERVSIVDLERVVRNLALAQDDVAWGPNNTFRFPLNGGTGEIFRRLAGTLSDRVLYGRSVVSVDPAAKTVRTAQGETITYDYLLSTMPLDLLMREAITDAPAAIRAAAGNLEHNGVYVGGVGVDGTGGDGKCWMYFPEDDCPFYRVTNFHNYSPNNTAIPARQRAFMCETSFSAYKPEDHATLMDRTIEGLVSTSLMDEADRERIASRYEISVDYGYPVPTLARDASLAAIQPWLEERGIFSRGRFGGWKYEVGNMDHSVMQGVEWAERMLTGEPETTYAV